MKEKIKRFFIEKKELLLFVAVLLVVFTTVIVVANYALAGEKPTDNDKKDDDKQTVVPGDDDDDDDDVVQTPVYKVTMPVQGEYTIVRTFFDVDASVEELTKAVINTGSYFIESQGISYAKKDNTVFNVYTILPGKVTNVQTDALEGTIVTVEHSDGVTSIYSSLKTSNVNIGDTLAEKAMIGTAGTSILDNEAGVHVHLEITVDSQYINPEKVFGKQASEVSSAK